jgi:hypothetical protein
MSAKEMEAIYTPLELWKLNEQRRYEVAKEILVAWAGIANNVTTVDKSIKMSVIVADAFIAELEKCDE